MAIDLVYLWVDGNDPVWRKKKNNYLPADRQLGEDVAGECRFVDNDELKYSLRSAERFAPWIRTIHIVTDGQCPAWLDTSHPRIRLVDHSRILPPDALPLFNASAIELGIGRIPDLAEHFLCANDDTFFGMPLAPDFFFDPEGRPVIRLAKQRVRGKNDTYSRLILLQQTLIGERFGKRYTLAPHHNIDAYRKSDFEAALGDFAERAEETMRHRFRTPDDLHRSLCSYFALATGRATLRRVGRYNRVAGLREAIGCLLSGRFRSDARCIPLTAPDYAAVLRKYNPALFALNDGENTTPADRERAKAFLQSLFPEKSQFEK